MSLVLIGIYGGIASGKTVLFDVMKKHGVRCLDCDNVIGYLFGNPDAGTGALMKDALCNCLGDVYDADGFNAEKANKVLSSDEKLCRRFSEITSEYTAIEVERALCEAEKNGESFAATDAFQVLSCGFARKADISILVRAPFFQRVIRLSRRENISARDAEKYISSLPDCTDDAGIDHVIENDSGMENLIQKCDMLVSEITCGKHHTTDS
jgi:Dephospho-CoA kinase